VIVSKERLFLDSPPLLALSFRFYLPYGLYSVGLFFFDWPSFLQLPLTLLPFRWTDNEALSVPGCSSGSGLRFLPLYLSFISSNLPFDPLVLYSPFLARGAITPLFVTPGSLCLFPCLPPGVYVFRVCPCFHWLYVSFVFSLHPPISVDFAVVKFSSSVVFFSPFQTSACSCFTLVPFWAFVFPQGRFSISRGIFVFAWYLPCAFLRLFCWLRPF